MSSILKPVSIGILCVTLLGLAVPDAFAWFPVARRVVVGTAVVAGTVAVASSTANAEAASQANAAAAANANAAAANANAAAARSAAAPAIGSMTTTLPPGCAPETLNGVAYERCGGTYYRATMSGNNLVFIVAQP